MDKRLEDILHLLIIAVVVLSLANTTLLWQKTASARHLAAEAAKANEPARLDITTITAASCKDCFDITPVVDSIKQGKVTLGKEKTLDQTSDDAKALIAKYKITKLPTIIAIGEVSKQSVNSIFGTGWQVDGNTAVYNSQTPPYTDAAGNVRGLVSLTQISDESCEKCAGLDNVIAFFTQAGVKFSANKKIDYKSTDAQQLITKFGIQRLPAIIVSKDILEYPNIAKVWPQLGAEEKEGMFALHTQSPPYRDLANNTIVGLAKATYITDKSCTACYDVTVNKRIIENNFGVAITSELTTDASKDLGKGYIAKYHITKLPVVLVSPEAGDYPRFVAAWKQVGDVADDGWYVMRNPNVLGTYKDLSTGQVVAPQPTKSSASG